MSRSYRRHAWLLAACAGILLPAGRTLACAVCFGDPESPMARGVVMGVVVLIGVVGFVLLGVAGTGLFWIQRGRRLARSEQAHQASAQASHPHDS